MSVKITCTASEAMYEEGALYGSDQPDFLELGPYEFVQLTYEGLRVGPDGDHIGFYSHGVWSIGVQHVPIPDAPGWRNFGPSPDGLLFSDVTISAA